MLEKVLSLEHWLLFQRTQVLFLVPIEHLIPICISRSGVPNVKHRHTQEETHTQRFNFLKL